MLKDSLTNKKVNICKQNKPKTVGQLMKRLYGRIPVQFRDIKNRKCWIVSEKQSTKDPTCTTLTWKYEGGEK